MVKVFLLTYSFGILLTGLGWLCHMYELPIIITLAISAGIISFSVIITVIFVASSYGDDVDNAINR